MTPILRSATIEDIPQIHSLYREVASNVGGLAREADEITMEYVANNVMKSLKTGIILIAQHPQEITIMGEIHSYALEPRVFSHVLSELTIAVHPQFQGMGLGRMLFQHLLQEVENTRNDILRVELIARESNTKAIHFYQQLGFQIEGKLNRRINSRNGSYEADIPMAWFNKYFKG
ncbi:GNAT family N-acetyltransferase [Rhodocytophaga rosea]|uniref:GNAT family N-acetyltransferase n=1 Tax=Rhodocytophaga rosea TaxID=2704465 RepID=A0A6C0GQB5_9BACT|nr:GNAT family N-acetyltransferase [Rhodocytophaga rosea]QHT70266.1 GNAT family N-acetyltransferase [Rhodocytophaga rosea]